MSQITPQIPLNTPLKPTNELLDKICAINGVEKVVITSREGFPLFSRPLPADQSDMKELLYTGGMLAPLMKVANESTERLKRESCELLTIECQDDFVIMCEINHGATLAVAATKKLKLGFLHYIVREYQQKLASLLNDWSRWKP